MWARRPSPLTTSQEAQQLQANSDPPEDKGLTGDLGWASTSVPLRAGSGHQDGSGERPVGTEWPEIKASFPEEVATNLTLEGGLLTLAFEKAAAERAQGGEKRDQGSNTWSPDSSTGETWVRASLKPEPPSHHSPQVSTTHQPDSLLRLQSASSGQPLGGQST